MGTSLVVQWLRLSAFTAEDMGLIPGWGTKTPTSQKMKLIFFLKLNLKK